MTSARVHESFLLSADGQSDGGEDRLIITDTVIAVFDGETDKSGEHGARTPGQRAVDALASAILTLDPKASSHTAVEHLTAAMGSTRSSNMQRPAAVAAILHLPSRQVWRVGDVAVGVDGEISRASKPTDNIAAAARAAMLTALIDDGHEIEELRRTDPGRSLVLPLLQAASSFRNRDGTRYSFAAFDGTVIPDSLVEVITLPARDCEVVLATDGYVEPAPTLELSEQALLDRITRDPLRIEDPPGLKAVRPGASSFDDRCYVRINVTV